MRTYEIAHYPAATLALILFFCEKTPGLVDEIIELCRPGFFRHRWVTELPDPAATLTDKGVPS